MILPCWSVNDPFPVVAETGATTVVKPVIAILPLLVVNETELPDKIGALLTNEDMVKALGILPPGEADEIVTLPFAVTFVKDTAPLPLVTVKLWFVPSLYVPPDSVYPVIVIAPELLAKDVAPFTVIVVALIEPLTPEESVLDVVTATPFLENVILFKLAPLRPDTVL